MNQNPLFDLGANNRCSITVRGGGYAVKTPYDNAFVTAIKQLPYSERRYEPTDKIWLVDLKHGKKIVDLVQLYFGETVSLPSVVQVPPQTQQRIIECHYIGTCKDRDGVSEAFGCDASNNWIYVFPEQVLRTYFDGTSEDNTPHAADTLYSILGISQAATQEEIRAGYRRMALQWHPDRCKEPNANTVFLRIKDAYEILSMPAKRFRYDAGLAFEATIHQQTKVENWQSMATSYRSPLRCGTIMCDGIEVLGKFKISKIILWQDVFNKFGQVLVSSWPMGAKEAVRVWA